MAIIVATTVVRLDVMFVAVFVTTFWTPPMSLLIRDCTSPVRVRVKKASESRCRCRKTDLVREERLNHAEDSRQDRDHDHPRGVQGNPVLVVRLDRDEQAAEQEGRHDAESGAEDDQPEQKREALPVRLEERPDPPHVRPTHLGIDRPFGRRLSPVVEEHSHQAN
jgi:hypothetical protein